MIVEIAKFMLFIFITSENASDGTPSGIFYFLDIQKSLETI